MNHKTAVIFLFLVLQAILPAQAPARTFIAHRGVNLRSTVAGENSIEAIRLARRAGFGAIETDVRLSADDSLVVMHDATLNRTCLRADGSEIGVPADIESLTWEELRRDYLLRADKAADRTPIPSLREYLDECRRAGLLTFIEPKLYDPSGRFYDRIIALADEILGRGNYVVTSNNRANQIIRRKLCRDDVRLMGILYQTTFDSIASLGNCIVAVSASRCGASDYDEAVAACRRAGLPCESHADRYEGRMSKIDRQLPAVDYVSTDFLAPYPSAGTGRTVAVCHLADFSEDIAAGITMPHVDFGAVAVEIDFSGEAEITLGPQTFRCASVADVPLRFAVMIADEAPRVAVKPLSADSSVASLSFTLTEF